MSHAKTFRVQARNDRGEITFDEIALTKSRKLAVMREAMQTIDSGHVRVKQANSRNPGLKWSVYRLDAGAPAAEQIGAFEDWPE